MSFQICFFKTWLLFYQHTHFIINSIAISYIDTSVEPPPTLTSKTIFSTSASSGFTSSLSGDIVTPTPTVTKGMLNTKNEM